MTDIDARYEKAKIYKLSSRLTTDVYIGSTIKTLNHRLSNHKSDYKSFIKNEYSDCTSYRLFEKGIDDVEIELIEDYNCNSKRELEIRERFHIENTINCINKNLPTRNNKEYKMAHREAISERMKEYYKSNKDVISANYQANREAILEKRKIKITCECGSVIIKGNSQRHKKSIKHTDYIAQITISIAQITI
jgi:hypothetical protein